MLVTILLVAFLGFTGVAAMVPGGLVQPRSGRAAPRATCCPGRRRRARRRAARLSGGRRCGSRACATRSGRPLTYAAAIAIGAAALRAMEIPRLVGPALLTLAFYLWDAFTGTAPARRRDSRWIWQIGLLAGLGRHRRRLEPAAALLTGRVRAVRRAARRLTCRPERC